jgi:fatty-acyl-CoA synthase
LVGGNQRLLPADRICVPVPLYHCFGMVMATCERHCGASIYPSAGFDPKSTRRPLSRALHRVYGVPTMFIAALGDRSSGVSICHLCGRVSWQDRRVRSK